MGPGRVGPGGVREEDFGGLGLDHGHGGGLEQFAGGGVNAEGGFNDGDGLGRLGVIRSSGRPLRVSDRDGPSVVVMGGSGLTGNVKCQGQLAGVDGGAESPICDTAQDRDWFVIGGVNYDAGLTATRGVIVGHCVMSVVCATSGGWLVGSPCDDWESWFCGVGKD
ncbi:hypothetical protein BDZ85DRAFT_254867 [Elsinoe ampelina]|uniref:Uncharacterized protein n=1 Tax=Elsinoe ampelina TaxID=302913 RepID=A0A6A6GQ41_9PEZI|nr:hypothetical protein BDZ85DRAFT_254867 [Elsinoe ampelina]